MTRRGNRAKRDDPANDVVEELYTELSEELGTDGPIETFGHPDESVVGRLVEDDEGVRSDTTSEVLATDSHDTDRLTAEEQAIHYVPEGDEDLSDSTLTRAVRRELEGF
ncbi:MAG: hypothetical protein KDC39_02560 [Actinobacteria bacterium]|nr:hypothetical protein [Actinomycetota bacterium]